MSKWIPVDIISRSLMLVGRSKFESRDYEPPPLKALLCGMDYYSERRMFSFNVVIKAIQAAGRTLHRLGFDDVENERVDLQLNREGGYRPLMLLRFDKLGAVELSRATSVLASLRSLHLQFSAEPESTVEAMTLQGNMRRVLSTMHSLEDLDLDVGTHRFSRGKDSLCSIPTMSLTDILGSTTYARLRRLALQNFWLEGEDLCEFLLRHKATLQVVILDLFRLGDFAGMERTPDGVGWVAYSDTPSENNKNDWYRIAQALRDRPRLNGLFIPLEMYRNTFEDVRMMKGVIDVAMDGRANAYESIIAEEKESGAQRRRNGNLRRAEE